MNRLLALLGAIAWCAVLVNAGAAGAGTASLVDGTLLYEASPGETNRVFVVDAFGRGFEVVDVTAPVAAGPGCTSVNGNEAFCPAPSIIALIHVIAGDMDDFVKVSASRYDTARLRGGGGEDELEGGSGWAWNFLDGGPGADVFHRSGPVDEPNDVIDYSSRTAPVTVTLDGIANDGEPGEGDRIGNGIRMAFGGAAGDTMSGSWPIFRGRGGNDTITVSGRWGVVSGGGGNDQLRGGSDTDFLVGGEGNDTVSGGAGSDEIRGDAGADRINGGAGSDWRLSGGPGADRLTGGTGSDFMSGGEGPDTLLARDRKRDRVDGGPGFDRARVDRARDRLNSIEEIF